MKVFFHPLFYKKYARDSAAKNGRMEVIVEEITPYVEFVDCVPATEADILAVHDRFHFELIREAGLYEIASLAAGGAIQAAIRGMIEPSFGLIRPPGHHASANSSWGFCFFNNMAISLHHVRAKNRIKHAYVLDFDYHRGDGNINILGSEPWVEILNPESLTREAYLEEVQHGLESTQADIIAVSAGFDHHEQDGGGLLLTSDYETMGKWVREAANRNGGGCFGILEGGYNHDVLGKNVLAFLLGLQG